MQESKQGAVCLTNSLVIRKGSATVFRSGKQGLRFGKNIRRRDASNVGRVNAKKITSRQHVYYTKTIKNVSQTDQMNCVDPTPPYSTSQYFL